MASKENINGLIAELYKQGQNSEYERALKTANKILAVSQEDEVIIRCKVTCLIQLSKFNDALQIINKNSKILPKLEFEKAYCLYRLDQVQLALKAVENIQSPSFKVKELKAQILYRLERYEECFKVYHEIVKNANDDYEIERETNLSAVIANLANTGSDIELPELKEQTFELTFNAACLLISKYKENGDANLLLKAEKKLRNAEKMCRESAEEDGLLEEEVEDELAIVKVQLGYCLQLQGKLKEAQTLYNMALQKRPDDLALIAVASNNIATLNKDQNVFDSKKKIKSATQESVQHKLTSLQKKNIAYNQCLLNLYTNQVEQCQSSCDKLINEFPDMKRDVTIIKAIQLSRDNKASEAVKILDGDVQSEDYLMMKLASVQLLLNNENRNEAIKVFESLPEKVKSLPGIVSTIVALLMYTGDREKGSQVLKNAVNYYKKNKENTSSLGKLWRNAADFHLRGGEVEVAAASLEELLSASPSDTKTVAQLIIAYAQHDPKKAQSLSKRLPPIDDLIETTDVDALESSNWVIGTKIVKRKVELSPGKIIAEPIQRKQKKRKRKGKLPKNYDANVQPDPERWLPRHERSNFKKKRDRRNRDAAMKGTQGAATGTSDQFDITKISSTKPSPNPRQNTATEISGPRQQQRKVQQKKKKKGGKW